MYRQVNNAQLFNGKYLQKNRDLTQSLKVGISRLIYLTLNLLTTTIVAPPSNASKWQMGFNSMFKGLKMFTMLSILPVTLNTLLQSLPGY
jgi:hypothetical protein